MIHRREAGNDDAGWKDIVKAAHGKLLRHSAPLFLQFLQDSERRYIVHADERCGTAPGCQKVRRKPATNSIFIRLPVLQTVYLPFLICSQHLYLVCLSAGFHLSAQSLQTLLPRQRELV